MRVTERVRVGATSGHHSAITVSFRNSKACGTWAGSSINEPAPYVRRTSRPASRVVTVHRPLKTMSSWRERCTSPLRIAPARLASTLKRAAPILRLWISPRASRKTEVVVVDTSTAPWPGGGV